MKLFKFKSIRTRLTYWFLVLTLVPLIVVLVVTYYQRVDAIESETFNKLTAIRDLKVKRLDDWLTERVGDLRTISADKELLDLQYVIHPPANGHNENEIITNAHRILHSYLSNYSSYYMIFVVNPITAKILVSTEKNTEGIVVRNEDFFTVPMATRKLSLTDIYFSNMLGEYTMDYSMPIFGIEDKSNQIVGILVAKTNLKNTLFSMLLDKVGLGETGETLIVNEDVVALNELRHIEDAPLNLQITAEPAVNAAGGRTGITIATDYCDEKVLAAYTYIPQTGWGFVCKQDMYELNEPIREMILNFIIIFILTSIVISIIAFYISSSISKPIVKIDTIAQKFGSGDLSVRNSVTSEDEVGSLAIEFNKMADATASKLKIQQGVSRISEALNALSTMEKFGSGILNTLMELTSANMSTFYILNETTKEYEHYASIGANKKLLSSFSAEMAEGEIGNAISTRGIYYLRDITENTIFKYNTVAGNAIPREMITIPVLDENTVVAIISLINLHKFSDAGIEILKQSMTGISISYSNLMAGERTRIFAEQLSDSNQQLEAQTEELQDQTEELQDQADELIRTSEELQEQNIELAAQRTEVELANKLKSEFLSNMSHELRTPLNSIMALSNVLITQTKDKLNDEEINYLSIVERSGKRLLLLINDILDLSKIEAGKMDIIPEPISVKTIIHSIADNFSTLAKQAGLTLTLDIPENLPHIENDESKLYQVLSNIISNAVKFTKKGSVTISATHDSENVIVAVKDTGIGISEEVLPNIFDEFRQADGSTARQYEGTGLGLAIASKMAKILGSKIEVTSKLNKGTTFTITIPINWHEEIIPSSLPVIEHKSVVQTGNTILVVDDDVRIIKNICEYLNQEGYHTISTTSGKEVLKLAEKYQPAAITLDIIMPEMDGWEVLQKLKSNLSTKNIPVVIVSVPEDKDTGFALGAMGYINKPIDKELFLAEIKRIIEEPENHPIDNITTKENSEIRILIVEDNEDAIIQLKLVMEHENYNYDVAPGGKEALEYIKHTTPDAIILDLMMPDVDGFEVLEKLRRTKGTKKIPVLVLTAKDLTKKDLARLSVNNIQQLILKGDIDFEGLTDKIKSMIGKNDKSSTRNPQPTVLIVEDNRDNMVTLKAILKDSYNIEEAVDGEQGLESAQAQLPDLILLDMSLPKIHGEEVVGILKSKNETKNIPIIAVTAQVMIGDKEHFIRIGCDGYISKPIDPELLLKEIGRFVG